MPSASSLDQTGANEPLLDILAFVATLYRGRRPVELIVHAHLERIVGVLERHVFGDGAQESLLCIRR